MATVQIDVDIDEFDDRDIVKEVIRRKLVDYVMREDAKRRNAPLPPERADVRSAASDAYHSLMARRYATAAEMLRQAIGDLIGTDLLEAYEAARDGHRDRAICALDKVLEPPCDARRWAA